MGLETLRVLPGIQRDGTKLDSPVYTDGEWVRFQRGRPRKMGGYSRISDSINGPVYGIHVWTRQDTNLIATFSGSGVEQVQVDNQFVGAAIYDRTPTAWLNNGNVVWQYTTLYDSAANSEKVLLIAHAGNNLKNIDDDTPTDIYYADVSDTSKLVPMGSEWQVSGGVVAAAPYLIAYGSDGKVVWSNQNEPRNATTGDAGTTRATDKKIIKGLPIRGSGKSPSILLWSLDSVIKMSYIGGPAVFMFDTITTESSVLSSSGIIEYDGDFYWAGLDGFMVYNGKVQELPNNTNLNYFYDNLEFQQRQKVFAMKVPRFGEIWWFYPVKGETECSRAVIYNVREQVWYDASISRTSSSISKTVRNPVMADSEVLQTTIRLRLGTVTGKFLYDEIVTGGFSGAKGQVVKVTDNSVYLKNVTGIFRDTPPETVTCLSGSSTVIRAESTVQYGLWLHEFGFNKIVGDDELSIRSGFETSDVSMLTGGPATPEGQPVNSHTRIVQIEPDFVQNGDITFNMITQKTARSPEKVSSDYRITETTEFIKPRHQGRIVRLRFSSDSLNGDYQLGKILIETAPGDEKA